MCVYIYIYICMYIYIYIYIKYRHVPSILLELAFINPNISPTNTCCYFPHYADKDHEL